MRICMVTSAPFPPKEGVGFYVWNLSRQLVRQGHQVQIITRGGFAATSVEKVEGIKIWRPTYLPTFPFHVHVHDVFVSRLVRELKPKVDVFHFHTPLVKHPKLNLQGLVTIHTPMKADVAAVKPDSLLGVLVKLQGPISYRLEQELFENADKITAVSHSAADELSDYGIDPSLVTVLGNGVDTDIFLPGKPTDNHKKPYFLTAGRLAPRKGLEDLLEAAEIVLEHFPDARFLIAGSGPLESRLVNIIEQRNLAGNIELLGHIGDREKLVDLYRGAYAYVHAAHYEGLPTVLLEAMACAGPVVATAVSGALDVVENGANGLLVPPKAPQHMADAIMHLLREPEFAAELGMSALRTIEESYSWEVVSRNYLAQYEMLLEGVPS